jgi:hypothetical protein
VDKDAEAIMRIVRADAELDAQIDDEARATAHALIQGYCGPDHKVISMADFFSALVQALKAARLQGRQDSTGRQLSF